MIASVVYALCALTSITCAVLLLRSYAHRPMKLLFWSGLCFIGLALNNILLFVDLVIVRDVDLRLWRDLSALGGVSVLVYGLVWETRS